MADAPPTRFIGLDIHKHYLVAVGVNQDQQQVFGPVTVQYSRLEAWIEKNLTQNDALVLEMSTNSFELYDQLIRHVPSVTLVHPPHVALIVRAQVKTDKKAALTLAQLHAAGLLPTVWVPPVEIRELRAAIAHRAKMVRLSTQAKNRLHAILHRHQILPPEGDPFTADKESWWSDLPLSALEKVLLESDLATLRFAQGQVEQMENGLADFAAKDENFLFLLQLPGFGLVTAVTVLAAIGDIQRFPSASQLVGYAGLGTRIHDSGMTHKSGRITKAGRRDLRSAMVQVARIAAKSDPRWQAELAKKEARIGSQKAIVAIARKLLVIVWHVLYKQSADRFAQPERVAHKLMTYAYNFGQARRPANLSASAYIRQQMDRLGMEVDTFKFGKRTIKLPPASRASPE